MKVCYYSDVTKKYYESEDALNAAEAEVIKAQKAAEEKSKARKARAKEVDDAYNAAVEARNKYVNVLNQFLKDYGSYHSTISSVKENKSTIDLFDDIIKSFFN